jgi:hypothetical protein
LRYTNNLAGTKIGQANTASAAEMIVAIARENSLAWIVGEKTAGKLLSATSVRGSALRFQPRLTTRGKVQSWKERL